MTTRKEDITNQIDGVKDTFETAYPYLTGTLMLGYNGQVYPPMWQITETGGNFFKLGFIPPTDTDALCIIYEDIDSVNESEMKACGRPPSGGCCG